MLRQVIRECVIPTRGRGFYEITDQAARMVAETGWDTGLLTLLLRHTSASLLIQENADPDVRRDLEAFFERICPDGAPFFRHTAEGPDDMPAHLRAALTAVSLTIPFQDGRLALGTWQGVYLWEHRRRSHRRRLLVHLLGGPAEV